jgi:hypothetical protein
MQTTIIINEGQIHIHHNSGAIEALVGMKDEKAQLKRVTEVIKGALQSAAISKAILTNDVKAAGAKLLKKAPPLKKGVNTSVDSKGRLAGSRP